MLLIVGRVDYFSGAPCYVCSYCRKGTYNLCPDMKFPATPPIDGTLCKYYCCSEDLCIKLPENFPSGMEGGALIEPLSVGVHACNQAGLRAGQSVIIFGAGPVGLLAAAAAKASGAIKVTLVDVNQSRLDFAKGYTADDVILAEEVTAGDNVIDHCKKFAENLLEAGKERSDVVLECSGAKSSIITGIYMTRPGGTYVQVGMGSDVVALPITHIGIREITIRGCFRYSNAHRQAVQMVAAGLIDLKPLVTHRYKFQEAIQAFQTVRDQKDGVIKALILGD